MKFTEDKKSGIIINTKGVAIIIIDECYCENRYPRLLRRVYYNSYRQIFEKNMKH